MPPWLTRVLGQSIFRRYQNPATQMLRTARPHCILLTVPSWSSLELRLCNTPLNTHPHTHRMFLLLNRALSRIRRSALLNCSVDVDIGSSGRIGLIAVARFSHSKFKCTACSVHVSVEVVWLAVSGRNNIIENVAPGNRHSLSQSHVVLVPINSTATISLLRFCSLWFRLRAI